MDRKEELKNKRVVLKSYQRTLHYMHNDITRVEREIEELEKEPEHRFYFEQPVLVSTDGVCFYKRVLKSMDNGIARCFTMPFQGGDREWNHVKPNPESDSIINWIEFGGDNRPDGVNADDFVIVQWRNGDIRGRDAVNHKWRHKGSYLDIVRYAIIKQPDWVG